MGLPGGGNGVRKKRRRARNQRNSKRRSPSTSSAHGESANRERIFQDIEGLLRQIRELAEESGAYSEQQLNELTQSVVGLFKALESEAPLVSDRSFSEYQRVRDKLSQALRSKADNSDTDERPV